MVESAGLRCRRYATGEPRDSRRRAVACAAQRGADPRRRADREAAGLQPGARKHERPLPHVRRGPRVRGGRGALRDAGDHLFRDLDALAEAAHPRRLVIGDRRSQRCRDRAQRRRRALRRTRRDAGTARAVRRPRQRHRAHRRPARGVPLRRLSSDSAGRLARDRHRSGRRRRARAVSHRARVGGGHGRGAGGRRTACDLERGPRGARHPRPDRRDRKPRRRRSAARGGERHRRSERGGCGRGQRGPAARRSGAARRRAAGRAGAARRGGRERQPGEGPFHRHAEPRTAQSPSAPLPTR